MTSLLDTGHEWRTLPLWYPGVKLLELHLVLVRRPVSDPLLGGLFAADGQGADSGLGGGGVWSAVIYLNGACEVARHLPRGAEV